MLSLLVHFDRLEKLALGCTSGTCDLALMSLYLPHCIESIRRDLYEPFLKHNNEDSLLAASDLLFRNSVLPLVTPAGCTPEQFPHLFTGANIRWETIGILVTTAGMYCTLTPPGDPLLSFCGPRQEDRRPFIRALMDASNACLRHCGDHLLLSDPGFWLTYRNCLFVSQVLGDSSEDIIS